MKKRVLATMVAMMLIFASLSYQTTEVEAAVCSHSFIFNHYQYSYISNGATGHTVRRTTVRQCTKCGSNEYKVPEEYTEKHAFGSTYDAGHSGGGKHAWRRACTNCQYTETTYSNCSGPPCNIIARYVFSSGQDEKE